MDDKEKEYFVPEQLDDNDFEKEKLEEKMKKKERKINKSSISEDEENAIKNANKRKLVNTIAMVLVVCLVAFGIYLYLNPQEKKTSEPEQVAKAFCSYLNDGNWKEVNNLLDIKGYYVLDSLIKDIAKYPDFDKSYKELKDSDKTYKSFVETVNTIQNIDEEILDSVIKFKINLKSIDACNKIQGTDSLYKLRVKFEYEYNGEAQSSTNIVYVSNASGEYKMVYGEWIQMVLQYYQSIYLLQTNNYSY